MSQPESPARPVRGTTLPYGRQAIDEDDIQAVVDVLRGDWLTTGPAVAAFEQAIAERVGAAHGVAVANGTAALHAAYHAAGVRPGDEVIVPAMTFAATANAALYLGARPVFADVDPETLLIDPGSVRDLITPRTRLLVGVDYAGQPCPWVALRDIALDAGIKTVADAAHSLGGRDADGRAVGGLADLTTFSFHPVKHITTGEGGMVTTDDPDADAALRRFRNHGLTTDHREREKTGAFLYDMVELGHNLRLSDLQCALGLSQLRSLDAWIGRRNEIARAYDKAFAARGSPLTPLARREGVLHAYHLYVARVGAEAKTGRDALVPALRAQGIGVNVHYKPVHLHSYYREHLGTGPGQCPVAEEAFTSILSLPMFGTMTDDDAADVLAALERVCV